MRPETAAAINSMATVLLSADESATNEDKAALVRALAGNTPRRELITARQAGAILTCCSRSVQNWGREGKLTPVKFGRRRIRWDKREVEAVAAQGFTPAAGNTPTRAARAGKVVA